jgi:hypothetical protein
MKTYNFKAVNWVIFILTSFFLLMGGAILLVSVIPRGHNTIFMLSFVVLILFIIYILRMTSFAKVEVTIDDDTISIKWLEQFLFSNKRDVTISFNEIATYSTQSDLNWDWFKIEMKDGNVYKIWRSNLLGNDDYSEFISEFISSVENHNIGETKKSVKENSTTIKRGKSIHETTGGLIITVFLIVIMVGFPILLAVSPSTKESNYSIFLLGYLGAIYFVFQVYTKRKGNKKKDKQ